MSEESSKKPAESSKKGQCPGRDKRGHETGTVKKLTESQPSRGDYPGPRKDPKK